MTARILTALVATLTAGTLSAQVNVGVVDFDLVFQSSTRARAAFAAVETYTTEKQAELKTRAERFQARQRELQSAVGLAEAELATRARELREEQTAIQRTREDAERETQRLTQAALKTLDEILGPLVRELAREKNLQLILQAGPDAGIVFVDPAIDLTADVIARLDALPE
ncbi:MAG: OmpH family outer membrane protein [Acidobacteriota bacterium]|nr:OmpH family outer membrane protein [Acidobacteriota bacterium]MDH3525686.1 OmpH family outer membrane protein [Acidobacteriota bacterium]